MLLKWALARRRRWVLIPVVHDDGQLISIIDRERGVAEVS
jgi:hypothetical protein